MMPNGPTGRVLMMHSNNDGGDDASVGANCNCLRMSSCSCSVHVCGNTSIATGEGNRDAAAIPLGWLCASFNTIHALHLFQVQIWETESESAATSAKMSSCWSRAVRIAPWSMAPACAHVIQFGPRAQ